MNSKAERAGDEIKGNGTPIISLRMKICNDIFRGNYQRSSETKSKVLFYFIIVIYISSMNSKAERSGDEIKGNGTPII